MQKEENEPWGRISDGRAERGAAIEPALVVLGPEDSARRADTFLGGKLEVRSSRGAQGVDGLLVTALDQKIE